MSFVEQMIAESRGEEYLMMDGRGGLSPNLILSLNATHCPQTRCKGLSSREEFLGVRSIRPLSLFCTSTSMSMALLSLTSPSWPDRIAGRFCGQSRNPAVWGRRGVPQSRPRHGELPFWIFSRGQGSSDPTRGPRSVRLSSRGHKRG